MPLDNIEVQTNFPLLNLKGTWTLDNRQRQAAWELYVELATRIAVVPLAPNEGLVREALSSLYLLFGITREILRRHGPKVGQPKKRGTLSIAVIAVTVLNRHLRPFLARWHPNLSDWETKRSEGTSIREHERHWDQHNALRDELRQLQTVLHEYVRLLEDAIGLKEAERLTEVAASTDDGG